MACVWKLPNGKSQYWIARFTDPTGKRRNKSTKQTDRRKAQALADKWEEAARIAKRAELTQAQSVQLLSEMMKVTIGEEFETRTIGSFLREWLATVDIGESSRARYQSVITGFLDHIGPAREKASIGSVTAREIQQFRDKQSKAGKSAVTCNLYLTVLKAALSDAREQQLMLTNPAEAVKPLVGKSAIKEHFTAEEVQRLIDHANQDWGGMIRLSFFSGLRLSDCAKLTWGEIDLEAGKVETVITKGKRHRPEPTTLALHPDVIAHLASLDRGIGKAPVFPSLFGKSSGGNWGGLSNEFSEIMQRAEIVLTVTPKKGEKGRNVNSKGFHSLRHSFVTGLRAAGVEKDVRKALAVHSTDEAHENYLHFDLDTQRKALASLPGLASASGV